MAIRNTRELAVRLRQSAADCEEAIEQVRPEHRTRLLKAAEHYRAMADKIETPSSIREPVLTSRRSIEREGVINIRGGGWSVEPIMICNAAPPQTRRPIVAARPYQARGLPCYGRFPRTPEPYRT